MICSIWLLDFRGQRSKIGTRVHRRFGCTCPVTTISNVVSQAIIYFCLVSSAACPKVQCLMDCNVQRYRAGKKAKLSMWILLETTTPINLCCAGQRTARSTFAFSAFVNLWGHIIALVEPCQMYVCALSINARGAPLEPTRRHQDRTLNLDRKACGIYSSPSQSCGHKRPYARAL